MWPFEAFGLPATIESLSVQRLLLYSRPTSLPSMRSRLHSRISSPHKQHNNVCNCFVFQKRKSQNLFFLIYLSQRFVRCHHMIPIYVLCAQAASKWAQRSDCFSIFNFSHFIILRFVVYWLWLAFDDAKKKEKNGWKHTNENWMNKWISCDGYDTHTHTCTRTHSQSLIHMSHDVCGMNEHTTCTSTLRDTQSEQNE